MRQVILGLLMTCILLFLYSKTQKSLPSIEIISPNNEPKQTYLVEIADTPQRITNGLMWRKSLPEHQGMWFDMTTIPSEQPIAFWMKNTLIELDILFIDTNNQIFYIKENAHPQDETLIWPPKRPAYVVEINGGQSRKHHFQVGDFIHKKFSK